MVRRRAAGFVPACAAACIACQVAPAQPDSQLGAGAGEEPNAAPDASPFSLELSLRYESGYYFRGVAQRPDAFNFQPAATLYFTFLDADGISLSVFGGVWNDFSSDTAPGSSGAFTEHWYEVDYLAGLSLTLDRLTLTAVYDWYESPASDFEGTQDVTLTLELDDAGLWGTDGFFSINPAVALSIDTEGAAAGNDGGVWLGLGVRPALALGATAVGDVTLAFPTGVGLGFSDYYQSEDGASSTFGYFETGAALEIDLAPRFGDLAPTVDIGVRWLHLDGVTREFNDGNADEAIFSVGMLWTF